MRHQFPRFGHKFVTSVSQERLHTKRFLRKLRNRNDHTGKFGVDSRGTTAAVPQLASLNAQKRMRSFDDGRPVGRRLALAVSSRFDTRLR